MSEVHGGREKEIMIGIRKRGKNRLLNDTLSRLGRLKSETLRHFILLLYSMTCDIWVKYFIQDWSKATVTCLHASTSNFGIALIASYISITDLLYKMSASSYLITNM